MNLLRFIAGALGFYRADTQSDDYDIVIANSFGTTTYHTPSRYSVNMRIRFDAEIMRIRFDGVQVPLVMDAMLTNCDSLNPRIVPSLVVEGEISTLSGKNTGTWGVLLAAREYMDAHGLNRPLIVGHGCHVYRTALQSRRLGMDPILPRLMIRRFDWQSKQLWTKSLLLWLPHELIGAPVLKKDGKL